MTFTYKNIVNLYIVYGINLQPFDLGTNFTLGCSLFGVVKLIKDVNPDKYSYSGYGTEWCGARLSNSAGFGKYASVFDVENGILKAKEEISQLLVKIQQMDYIILQ